MAGKSRRVASRQAQLSRRRKKQQKGTAEPVSAVQVPAEVDSTQPETVAPLEAEPSSPATAPAPAPVRPRGTSAPAAAADRREPAARTPRRARSENPATFNYSGAEMRRILVLATAVMVIIVVLGFTL